jgi:hypothetical protein
VEEENLRLVRNATVPAMMMLLLRWMLLPIGCGSLCYPQSGTMVDKSPKPTSNQASRGWSVTNSSVAFTFIMILLINRQFSAVTLRFAMLSFYVCVLYFLCKGFAEYGSAQERREACEHKFDSPRISSFSSVPESSHVVDLSCIQYNSAGKTCKTQFLGYLAGSRLMMSLSFSIDTTATLRDQNKNPNKCPRFLCFGSFWRTERKKIGTLNYWLEVVTYYYILACPHALTISGTAHVKHYS